MNRPISRPTISRMPITITTGIQALDEPDPPPEEPSEVFSCCLTWVTNSVRAASGALRWSWTAVVAIDAARPSGSSPWLSAPK